jgi:DNA-binding response OmpR family regulator
MKKILIFDDEEDILEITELMLKKDYDVHTEASLEDPVHMVQSIEPDLILMDLYIPPIGGEKAVKLLKENENTKNVKIILFSASDDVRELTNKSGADGYFTKPFEVRQLKEFLGEQLRH